MPSQDVFLVPYENFQVGIFRFIKDSFVIILNYTLIDDRYLFILSTIVYGLGFL